MNMLREKAKALFKKADQRGVGALAHPTLRKAMEADKELKTLVSKEFEWQAFWGSLEQFNLEADSKINEQDFIHFFTANLKHPGSSVSPKKGSSVSPKRGSPVPMPLKPKAGPQWEARRASPSPGPGKSSPSSQRQPSQATVPPRKPSPAKQPYHDEPARSMSQIAPAKSPSPPNASPSPSKGVLKFEAMDIFKKIRDSNGGAKGELTSHQAVMYLKLQHPEGYKVDSFSGAKAELEALYVELRKLKEPLSDKQFKDLYVKWQSS